jgi:hypothetical protein
MRPEVRKLDLAITVFEILITKLFKLQYSVA